MALFDNTQESGFFNLGVDETAKGHMLETARWAKFLAIIGFVLLGLLVLAGIFMSTIMGTLMAGSGFNSTVGGASGLMMVVYIIFAAIYFFPTYYLYKFAVLIKPAILTGNQEEFNTALSYLRSAFRFIGIMMLIVLGIYALVFIVGIIGFAFT